MIWYASSLVDTKWYNQDGVLHYDFVFGGLVPEVDNTRDGTGSRILSQTMSFVRFFQQFTTIIKRYNRRVHTFGTFNYRTIKQCQSNDHLIENI